MRHQIRILKLGVLVAVVSVLAYICYAFDLFVEQGQIASSEKTIELDEALLLGWRWVSDC